MCVHKCVCVCTCLLKIPAEYIQLIRWSTGLLLSECTMYYTWTCIADTHTKIPDTHTKIPDKSIKYQFAVLRIQNYITTQYTTTHTNNVIICMDRNLKVDKSLSVQPYSETIQYNTVNVIILALYMWLKKIRPTYT